MERALIQENYQLAVGPPRVHLINYFMFFFVCALLLTGVLFFCLLLASGLLFIRPSPDPSLVVMVQIFMATLSLPLLFSVIFLSSFALFTMRRLLSHKPTLLITDQGIELRDLPMVGNIFLSWSEVASLSVSIAGQSLSGPIHHLCFDPKNHGQFLAHFHPLRRFLVRCGSVATGTLIPVPQWFLSEPVEEVLFQIQELFQEKLRTYEVQILSPHAENHGPT